MTVISQAEEVYDLATPEEKGMMGRVLLQKRFGDNG